jgi:hypothetical protein
MVAPALFSTAMALLGASTSASFDSEAAARLFVSACLDGQAALPKGAVEVDRAVADMPASARLANDRYYKLTPNQRLFLRIADPIGDAEIDHFCELRGKHLQLKVIWPIVANAVDRRIDKNPTSNIDYYEIDYPAMQFRVKLHPEFLLLEHYRQEAAVKQKKKLPLPEDPNVTRTDLPY